MKQHEYEVSLEGHIVKISDTYREVVILPRDPNANVDYRNLAILLNNAYMNGINDATDNVSETLNSLRSLRKKS